MNISELSAGQVLKENDEFMLLLTSVQLLPFSNKPGEYLSLNFQDKSGTITGKMWEVKPELENLKERCESEDGLYVKIIGKVNNFVNKQKKEETQIIADFLHIVDENDIKDFQNFIPVVQQDRNEMIKELKHFISMIKNQGLKVLVKSVFSDEEYFNDFLNGIAAKSHHHNYIGGLLEHTLQVVTQAVFTCEHHRLFPELNKDLVIAGALLHDIGKIKEYRFKKAFSMNPYSIEHRYEGIAIIEKTIERHKLTIDPKLLRDIKLILASHHGTFGDPTIRMDIPEAMVVHSCDMISASVNKFLIEQKRLYKAFEEN